MDPVARALISAALGATMVVLAIALCAALVLQRTSLGDRFHASGNLRLPGAWLQGEIEVSSRK
jgi:hypothetical protein